MARILTIILFFLIVSRGLDWTKDEYISDPVDADYFSYWTPLVLKTQVLSPIIIEPFTRLDFLGINHDLGLPKLGANIQSIWGWNRQLYVLNKQYRTAKDNGLATNKNPAWISSNYIDALVAHTSLAIPMDIGKTEPEVQRLAIMSSHSIVIFFPRGPPQYRLYEKLEAI